MNLHLGLSLAMATLCAWSISPFFFTACGRRIGPTATNLLRLLFATLVLLAMTAARAVFSGGINRNDLPAYAWLMASGAIGLALGDTFLYRSFVDLGPERTSQMQTLAPAFTVALAAFLLQEYLSPFQLLGMALILSGVFLVTWNASKKKISELYSEGSQVEQNSIDNQAEPLRTDDTLKNSAVVSRGPIWLNGVWASFWSAMFQGIGTVMARHAFILRPHLDSVAATAVRLCAGAFALWTYSWLRGPIGPILGNWRTRPILKRLAVGTLLGPILGMLTFISALKYAPAGIVTTITFMTPLLIIPLGAWRYGRRITAATVAGTALSLVGVILLGMA